MTLLVRTCWFMLLPLAVQATCTADDFSFFHENVIGTSLELRVSATNQAAANQAETAALQEIERLSRIFSHYDSNSEFSRFRDARIGESVQASAELFETLRRCDEWSRVSEGAFNVAAEQLLNVWHTAESVNSLPTRGDLIKHINIAAGEHWSLNFEQRTAVRKSDAALTLNAIAKGVILDLTCERVLSSSPEVHGVMLNIGGDLRVAGDTAQAVSIANPKHDAIGAAPLQNIVITEGAVATSGSSERGFLIAGKSYSHIIDPRTGQPVSNIISASVVAEDAATADAVATICNVMPAAASLVLVNSLPNVECLLVTSSGLTLISSNWPGSVSDEAANSDEKPKTEKMPEPTGHEMKVEFEITKPANNARYRRPYVAVWVEDKDGFPVKTLSLFLMAEKPGPRWHRDLRRWYASDQMRRLVDDQSLIDTVSKPTRNPGTYKVEWDGRDDSGNVLKPGKYTINFEAAREHGTYQLTKHEFQFGGESFLKELKGNTEIKSASVKYTKK